MTRAGALRVSLALSAVLACASALGQSRTLQHDPFARPFIGGFGAQTPPGAAAPAQPKLRLQAVLVAGDASFANVDGVIVRVGESVHGYRLVAVHDRSAVFEKNNSKLTLTIRDERRAQPGVGEAK
jgi:hypothetical protein